jgi:hypothetical protein
MDQWTATPRTTCGHSPDTCNIANAKCKQCFKQGVSQRVISRVGELINVVIMSEQDAEKCDGVCSTNAQVLETSEQHARMCDGVCTLIQPKCCNVYTRLIVTRSQYHSHCARMACMMAQASPIARLRRHSQKAGAKLTISTSKRCRHRRRKECTMHHNMPLVIPATGVEAMRIRRELIAQRCVLLQGQIPQERAAQPECNTKAKCKRSSECFDTWRRK